jgi:hypothetical protein
MHIAHEAVESSNIESVGYDDGARLLEVKFKSGSVHRYHDVPTKTHAALMAASSKGQFFAKHIRSKFKNTKVSK